MVLTVVLVLAVAASGLSLPVTTEVETAHQTLTQAPVAQFVEKTGVESSPEVYAQVGQVQVNAPIPKEENVPINVEQQQGSYQENPVFLPVQPLSVVPAVQVGQVPRPIIVPAEAISAGRVIIAGVEPIQQKNEFVSVENSVPYQQITHPVTHTEVQAQGVQPNQQPYYVQTNEKQTPLQQGVVPTGLGYVPVQGQTYPQPLVKETVPVKFEQGNVEQVEYYTPAPAEYNPQVYSAQHGVQAVSTESAEKNVKYQVGADYFPVHTAQYPAQQAEEKQGYHHVSGYTPAQSQGVVPENQYDTGIKTETVEKQVPQQQFTEYQQQVYNTQQAEKHGEYQQVNPTAQNQVETQQVHNVQQEVEKHGQYQTQSVETQQQQVVQQGTETHLPVQRIQPIEPAYNQQVYNLQNVEQPVKTHPVEPVNHQQVYSVQPAADQVVPYHQSAQQQTADYGTNKSEYEYQQTYVQQQPTVNYATETNYNYGDKIRPQSPVVL